MAKLSKAPKAAPPPLKPLVVLEDAFLMNLSTNRTFLNEFPFLAKLRQVAQSGGCGGCGQRAMATRPKVLTETKLAIASLDGKRRERFKALLRAKQIRFVYLDPSGKKIQHQF